MSTKKSSPKGQRSSAATPPVARDPKRQFVATIGTHEALDIAAEVARTAAHDGEDPRTVGAKRFDAARKAMGSPGLSSGGLRNRFKTKHTVVLDMALTRAEDRGFVAPRSDTTRVQRDMPETLMWQCLRACHYQLGITPSRSAYDTWATRHARERQAKGGPEHYLPHSVTLIRKAGTWNRALAAAGLDPADSPAGRHATRVPDVLDTLDDFLSEYGLLPVSVYFVAWCERRDIPVARKKRTWGAIYAELRARRTAAGQWTPDTPTPSAQCPPLPDPPSVAGRPARRVRRLTEEQCLESLRIYGAEYLPAGQRPTQSHYRGHAVTDDRLVSPTSLQRFGQFQELCRKAGI